MPKNNDSPDLTGAAAALNALKPKLAALSMEGTTHLRADVSGVVLNVIEVARAYAEDRALFAQSFKPSAIDLSALDDLRLRGLALWQADVQYRQAVDPEGAFATLVAEAQPLRKKMLKAAEYLFDEDPELAPVVADIRAGQGYKDTADDLVALAALFERQWVKVKERSNVEAADLPKAIELGTQIMESLNQPEAAMQVAAARDALSRAMTYARQGVDEARAAAAFVFRNNPEAMQRYPSIMSGLRKKKANANDVEEPGPVVEPSPVGPAVEPSPATPVTSVATPT